MTDKHSDTPRSRAARYFRQSVTLLAALFLAGLLLASTGTVADIVTPLVVSAVYALVLETVEIRVWERIATRSADSLPTFFMAASGFRFMAALVVMFAYFLLAGREGMPRFILVFAVFYLAALVHHSLFFYRKTGA